MFGKKPVSSTIIENHANGQDACKGIKLRETCEEFAPFSEITEDIGLNDIQCEALRNALGEGPDGRITEEEIDALSRTGIPDAFIFDIAGQDGKRPVRKRVGVIRDTIFRPPNRIDLNILREIREIGPEAVAITHHILREIDYLTEGLRVFKDRYPSTYEYLDTTRKSNRAVQAMIESIIGMNSQDGIVKRSLIGILEDDVYDGETHALAAQALGLFKATEALPLLVTAAWGNFLGFGMESTDEARVEAALAASRIDKNIDKKKVTDLMLSMLYKFNSGSVRAARALGEIDSDESRHALMSLISENPDYKSKTIATREEAARALGKLKATESIGHLTKVLINEPLNTPLCRASAWALGEIGSREAIAPLRLALKNGAASVHFAAAEALLKIDKDIALEEIVTVMRLAGNESSPLERMAAEDAGRALIDIGSPEALAEVERAAEDPKINNHVRKGLNKLLSFYTDKKATGKRV